MSQERQRLLARLAQRVPVNTQVPFTVLDYVHAIGSPLDAWLYSELLWPDFTEVNGMVFLADAIEDAEDRRRVEDALREYNNDRVLTQKSFNTIVVEELFGRRTGETTPDEDGVLARRIAETWKARLSQRFPADRVFVGVEPPDAATGVAVTFYLKS